MLLLPWPVLAATAIFAWVSFLRRELQTRKPMVSGDLLGSRSLIAIYGGYFGGGIGFFDAGGADHRRPAGAHRRRHQERAGGGVMNGAAC